MDIITTVSVCACNDADAFMCEQCNMHRCEVCSFMVHAGNNIILYYYYYIHIILIIKNIFKLLIFSKLLIL